MEYLTRDEIKKVFEYFDEEDFESISKIIDDPIFKLNPNEMTDEQVDKIYEVLASKIDKNDYEFIADDDIGKDFLENIIIGTKNIKLIKECIQNQEYRWNWDSLSELVMATNDPDFIKSVLITINQYDFLEKYEDLEDNYYIKKLVLKTQDEEFAEKYRENYKISSTDLIIATNDEDFIKECVTGDNDFDKKKLIIATNDPDFIKKCIEDSSYDWTNRELKDLIIATDDPSYIEKCIDNKISGENFETELIIATKDENYIKTLLQDEHRYNKVDLLIKTKNIKLIEECIKTNDENNYGLSDNQLITLMSETGDVEFILDILQNNKKLDGREIRNYLKNNIEHSIKTEGENDNISYRKECLMKMYALNNDVLKKIDFNILNPRYIETLGIDKVNQISCYPEIQEKVIALNNSQLKVFSKSIEHCASTRWTPLANIFLYNLPQYEELIENISQFEIEEIDFKKINMIIQDENIFDIKTLENMEKYEQIRKEKCNEWIKSDDISQKKQAILEKIYGQSLEYSEMLIRKYGQDIEKIQDGDYKDYVQSVKSIFETENPNTLEKIYEQCKQNECIDKIYIEENLKSEYGKLYKEGLFSIEQGEKIEEGIYEAGTDFKIILTALSAFEDTERIRNNYQKDWNRPAIASQHFCASYIRNDMIGTADLHDICYRLFSNFR